MYKLVHSDVDERKSHESGSGEVTIDHTFHLDRFIDTIEQDQIIKHGSRSNISELDCRALCAIAKQKFLEDNMIIDIKAPVKICGDIHGQIYDLMRIFNLCGHPSKQRYLFLGDYVDRGTTSLDVISILFAYKVKYPNNMFLLRGNHESLFINAVYGFKKEIRERFNSSKTWRSFNATFDCLPIAAIVDNSIFCCHGGLSPEFLRPDCQDLRKSINLIERPLDVPTSGIMCDLLWSDPMDSDGFENSLPLGWFANNRGCSYTFGFDAVEEFLNKFEFDLVVRGHQVVNDGYEFYCDGSLVTIFSASNYCGTFDNAAGIFNLEPNGKPIIKGEIALKGGFHILPPDRLFINQWSSNKPKDGKIRHKKSKSNQAFKNIPEITTNSNNRVTLI